MFIIVSGKKVKKLNICYINLNLEVNIFCLEIEENRYICLK